MMLTMKKIDIKDPQALDLAVKVLLDGGVLMHPTETCYGLAVDIFNREAVKKLYEVKKMALDKPVSILVSSFGMAQEFGIFDDISTELAMKYWPGPLSIVLPRKKQLPRFLNPDEDFVSIRCSELEFCEDLTYELGRPVSTTSANISGEPQMYEPRDLEGVDLIIDGGKIEENLPSTIVKVSDGRLDLLRQGGLLLEGIEESKY